jgi:hypothetical protein
MNIVAKYTQDKVQNKSKAHVTLLVYIQGAPVGVNLCVEIRRGT